MRFDVVVIGGGPAGMAAALAAHKNGVSVLIVERDSRLGGILNQCIHAGFGLHYFGEEMTGTEYANRFLNLVNATDIHVLLNSMVLKISDTNLASAFSKSNETSAFESNDTSAFESNETSAFEKNDISGYSLKTKMVSVLSPELGMVEIEAGAVVLAMGCRERTAGAIALPGTRPVGIYTAGMAQKLCNQKGYLVGKKVVLLGSGDIGLIMARRMTFEGAKVEMVLELLPFSSGLKRNIVQCLDDFDIPIKYSHTITKIVGKPRLCGLYYAPIDCNRNPIFEEEKFVECDTLLLSVGLIPENDLLNGMDIDMSQTTSGAIVDENRMTSVPGIFSCGNVLHVHDLVDNVSDEAEIAGLNASNFAIQSVLKVTQPFDNQNTFDVVAQVDNQNMFNVVARDGVRYALPQRVHKGHGNVKIFFRVVDVHKNSTLVVECKNEKIFSRKYMILSPGEMENITIDKEKIKGELVLRLENATVTKEKTKDEVDLRLENATVVKEKAKDEVVLRLER